MGISTRTASFKPLTFLLAVLTGSSVALASGLLLTWVVILFLPGDEARFAPEHGPLLRAVAVFTVLAATTAVSFYAEMLARSWRFAAHAATVAVLGLAIWTYWPSKGGL